MSLLILLFPSSFVTNVLLKKNKICSVEPILLNLNDRG